MLSIKTLRNHRKLTIVELAQKIHVSRSRLSEIESGAQSPSLPTLYKIAEGLEVPAWKILYIEDNSSNQKSALEIFKEVEDL